MGNNIRSSSRPKALAPSIPMPPLADAMDAVHLSVDRFCLLAGVEALAEMMEEDATTVGGARHRRHGDRRGYRWGRTHSEIGYHGGKVKVARPRVRDRAGKEVSLESWQALRDGNLLLEWALNLMVLNVSTRKYHRAVRLPEGDLAKARGDGTSKSAVSRRFVALSRKKMKAWLASDLSELDLLEHLPTLRGHLMGRSGSFGKARRAARCGTPGPRWRASAATQPMSRSGPPKARFFWPVAASHFSSDAPHRISKRS